MPIPDISRAIAPSQGAPMDSPSIVSLVNNINALRPGSPRSRLLAFGVDLAFLYGVSIKISQWIGILMLRSILQARTGAHGATLPGFVISSEGFQFAYQYSVVLIWPVALLFCAFAYFVSSTHLWGATLGQGLLDLRVVTRRGELPSLERSGKRFFASIISLCTMGIFFVLGAYGRDGICFHDDASGTRVVSRESWKRSLWSSLRGVDAKPQSPHLRLVPALDTVEEKPLAKESGETFPKSTRAA